MLEIKFLLVLFIILVLNTKQRFFVVDSIKCYVCQSNVDPKCADPFDNLTLPITDCDEYPRHDLVYKSEMDVIEEKGFFATFGLAPPVKPLRATMCRKIRQKVNGEWRTIRGCGYLGPPGETVSSNKESSANNHPEGRCQIRHGAYDIFMETCTCNSKDGCNAAAGLKESASFLLMPILLTLSATTLTSLINLCNRAGSQIPRIGIGN